MSLAIHGSGNTANGYAALASNTGNYNTAAGAQALTINTTGANQTAIGYSALAQNTTGSANNAQGYEALYSNTTGSNNNAIGSGALYANTTGHGNNAMGLTALENVARGNRNTAVGNNAGLHLVDGSYNTYVGWGVNGSTGVKSTNENYVTRIGVTYADRDVSGAPTTYISGIWGTTLTGTPAQVVVNANGQLGVVVSSERYKMGVASLGTASGKLSQLRPVSFHLKTDPSGAVQYGLIAEEVDKVYPELVIRDNDGKIQGVRYDELAPMLLNEMQKEHATVATLFSQHEADAAKLDSQAKKIASLEQQLAGIQAALVKLQPKDELVAQR